MLNKCHLKHSSSLLRFLLECNNKWHSPIRMECLHRSEARTLRISGFQWVWVDIRIHKCRCSNLKILINRLNRHHRKFIEIQATNLPSSSFSHHSRTSETYLSLTSPYLPLEDLKWTHLLALPWALVRWNPSQDIFHQSLKDMCSLIREFDTSQFSSLVSNKFRQGTLIINHHNQEVVITLFCLS